MWRNLVQLCVIVQQSLLQDGLWAVDLVWTVWKLFSWLMLKNWSGDTQVLMYTRAAASDYDDWVNIYGNKGWGSMHLIPLLKKVRALRSTYMTLELTVALFYRQKHSNRLQRIQPMATRDPSKCRLHKIPRRILAEVSFLLLKILIKNVVY